MTWIGCPWPTVTWKPATSLAGSPTDPGYQTLPSRLSVTQLAGEVTVPARVDHPELAVRADRDAGDLRVELGAPAHRAVADGGGHVARLPRHGLHRAVGRADVEARLRARRLLRGGRPDSQAAEHARGDDQRRGHAKAGFPPAATATAGRRQVEHRGEQFARRLRRLVHDGYRRFVRCRRARWPPPSRPGRAGRGVRPGRRARRGSRGTSSGGRPPARARPGRWRRARRRRGISGPLGTPWPGGRMVTASWCQPPFLQGQLQRLQRVVGARLHGPGGMPRVAAASATEQPR